jgi:NuA3 HAT complex component NTO1
MRIVREDLERVRMLVELSHKREKEKSRQARALQDFIEDVLFPHDSKLRLAFQKITRQVFGPLSNANHISLSKFCFSLDRQQAFAQPVSLKDVPDYLDIIKTPICWQDIDEKLDAHAYVDLAEFQVSALRGSDTVGKHLLTLDLIQRHVFLVLENAMLYNPSDHLYHRLAVKIKKAASVIFTELYTQLAQSLERPVALGEVFSLEPSREFLEPLLVVEPGSNRDRLGELFARELESLPPPSPLPKYKPIVTHEERQARRQAKIDERRARAEALRLASSRQTRSNAPTVDQQTLGEDILPKELRSLAVKPKTSSKREPIVETKKVYQNASRSLRSGGSAGPIVAPEGIQAILPSIRKQTGVIGTMAYSPLSDQERRARERDMQLVVDTVDNKDYFERFNVGFILPEGTKRGGRPFVPTPPVAGPSRRRHGEFIHFRFNSC